MKTKNIFLLGFLIAIFAVGCTTFYQSTVTLTAAVDAASKEYARAFNTGLVTPELDAKVTAAHELYQKSARTSAEALRAYKLSGNKEDYLLTFSHAQQAAMSLVEMIVPFVTRTKATELIVSVEKAKLP